MADKRKKSVHIAVLMMVKNEHKRLLVSLESIKNTADSFIMYDTGSTDNTIEIAEKFCQDNGIPFRLKQGEFVDFATSRNVSLDFADEFPEVDYLLLLDTNDELKNRAELRAQCEKYYNLPNTGFLLKQEWWSGRCDTYYNIRLIKARKGWRYRGRVHEWIKNTRFENDNEAIQSGDVVIRLDEVVIYQDRTATVLCYST